MIFFLLAINYFNKIRFSASIGCNNVKPLLFPMMISLMHSCMYAYIQRHHAHWKWGVTCPLRFLRGFWCSFQKTKNSRFIFSIFNTIATGVIRTFSVSYHQLLNSNMRSLVGAEPETGSVPNGTLNPRGLPLSPHFRDVMPLWLSGRSLMRACTSAGSAEVRIEGA